MSSKSEVICKQCFNKYLTMKLEIKDVRWLDNVDPNKPPDYYVEINRKRYAVEVTTIMEEVLIDGGEFPIVNIYSSLTKLLNEVEEKTLKEGVLKGTYAVTFSAPITNLRQFQDNIKQGLINYIVLSQNDPYKESKVIFKQKNEKVTVLKINNRFPKIGIGGPPRAKWDSEAKQEALHLIQDRISDKKKKLSKIEELKILLLLNYYLFLDIGDYKDFVPELKDIENFHTVFLVENEENGYILYSNNSNW